MDKKQFITTLKNRLGALPFHEVDKIINYYSELIDDKMEDGMSEEVAINSLGSIDTIVNEIVNEISVHEIVKRKVKKSYEFSTNKTLWIVLVILTSPIWASLTVALLACILAALVSVWAIIFAIIATIGAIFLAGIFSGVYAFVVIPTNFAASLLLWAFGFISTGITLLLFAPIIKLAKCITKLPARCVNTIKQKLTKVKEEV